MAPAMRRILASKAPELRPFRFLTGAGSVELVAGAEAQGDQPAKLPAFKMNVYNGGPMRVGYYGPVIIDLAGLRVPDRPVPVHRDHDTGKIVGHGEGRIEGGRVFIEGTISGTGEAAREVVGNSRNGFPWQASIEADPLRVEDLKAGAQANVNGRPVSGPMTIVRVSELKGASFVSLGADASTRAVAAAKEREMNFREWLIAKGFDPDALQEGQLTSLQAAFDAEQAAAQKKAAAGDGDNQPAPAPAPVKAGEPTAADQIKAERERIAAIEAACRSWGPESREKVDAIRAQAIAQGQTVGDVNAELLKLLRASRPTAGAPVIIRGSDGAGVTSRVLAAALCVAYSHALRLDDKRLEAEFGAKTLETVRDQKLNGARLGEVIEAACRLDGIELPRFGRGSQEWVRAAFSSASLAGILGAVANKSLLAAYAAIPPGIRRVFAVGTVANFQTHTRYRMTAAGTFEKMAPAGELQHGRLGQDSYTQKADTYGRYFKLTRQDVINDDLGAFLQIPAILGRGWALAIEEAGVTLLLSNPSTFFNATPSAGTYAANYQSGAGSALGTAALDAAVALFLAQVDTQGKPVSVEPALLVVPPALKALAERLFVSENLGTVASSLGATSSRVVEQAPEGNIYRGRYQPVCIPQLSNANFTGYSATAWYLFADPAVLAAGEVAYLNGQAMPTIEAVGVDPDTLGLGFRGYGDFGVAMVDPRAAVKSAGA